MCNGLNIKVSKTYGLNIAIKQGITAMFRFDMRPKKWI